ncbi:MAG: LTA synthase family protein [Collinsella sp.]|nr:LTA synthase family protein [Collinsella sp.]
MLVAIITLASLAAALGMLVRDPFPVDATEQDAPSRGDARRRIVSALPFLVIQAFVGIYAAFGMVSDDLVAPIVVNAILLGCSHVAAHGGMVRARLDALTSFRGRPIPPIVPSIILMLVAGLFATLALEVPSNHNLLWMYPLCFLLEWMLISFVMIGLFLLFQRRSVAPAIAALVLHLIGIAEYFVITFKSMPIAPGDISALSTAVAVSGSGYVYSLTPFCLYGMALLALSVMSCRMAAMLRPASTRGDRRALLVNILVGLICLGGVAAHVTMVDYYNTLRIQIYTWRPLESYYRQGFLPSFISGAQTIKPPLPEGYSVDAAKGMMEDYAARYDAEQGQSDGRVQAAAQFDEEQPTVITIMNETFADLSIYQNLHSGYEGPQFFKNIPDALQRGTLYVSAYGGGTCNTEFEYLTGNSMAFLGPGVYPYTIYDLARTESLAEQFKALGYKTTAIHPNHATNWNRENVYKDFGFDQFLTIKDFQGSETLRGMVTDQATYDRILQMLEEDEAPQFIFDVTMQNHSGYNTGLLPYDKQVNYAIDGMPDAEVNEYLALIEESDRALEDFMARLSKLDRKVILVFFGDHQPFFPDRYNEAWFPGEDPAVHAERLWQTDYVIWANYDVAGREQKSDVKELSTNYLGSVLLDLIGAPMSDYRKAHIVAREALPAINSTGFEDRDSRWYLSSAASDKGTGSLGPSAKDAVDVRHDLAMMQYYELFRDGKSIYAKNFQSAANETDPNLAPGTTKIK